ncbi:MAG: peptidoglycan DD-metalloendopeptidase family protein [Pseudomonadota bacterium]
MKKKSDPRLMHFSKPRRAGRTITAGIATLIASVFALSACTTYRPVDQGSSVPWAKALADLKGGPIDGNRYRVEKGDALSGIAARYDVRLATLAAANNIEAPYVLYPGEVLRIPDDVPLPTRRPEIIQTALPPAGAGPAPTGQAWTRQETAEPAVEGERYTVVEGESLALIAVRRGLTLGDLVAANDIEPPYQIKPGQLLIIPPSEASSRARIRSQRQRSLEVATPAQPSPPLSGEGFIWPVDGELIGTFDENSRTGRSGGVNIAARKGTPVRASESGVVAYAGEAVSGYGRMLMLRHDGGYVTLYAHNDVILVREGDVVRRGQPIAEVGSSGDVTESQLHFELRKGKAPIDPTKVLADVPGRQIGKL